MFPKLFFLGFLATLAISTTAQQKEELTPVVTLKAGKLRGTVTNFEHHSIYFYQGIRYGTAKRFSAPEPVKHWSDTYNATRFQFACPQQNVNLAETLPSDPKALVASEDCLFLNIWRVAPKTTADIHSNRPVMVWIHGGAFVGGTIFTDFHDGRYLAEAGDVVVVAINYRLGALGFLSGDNPDAPGNLGLRDQQLALHWIQENIHQFGGDPKKVTIFGESAGSMSVGALVLSPLSAGLFHRAIMQSGAPNAYLGSASLEASLKKTVAFAGHFNCPESSYMGLVGCLRNISLSALLEKDKNGILDGESFFPLYGDAVLPQDPVKLLKTGAFNHKVDLMFGVTSGEGSGFVSPYIPDLNPSNDGHDMSVEKAHNMISFLFQLFRVKEFEEVADFYTKGLANDTDKDVLRAIVAETFGDYHLICPTVFFGQEMATHQPSNHYYSYRLTHQTKNGCRGWQGVCHAEDDNYLFASPMKHLASYSAEDYQLAVDMVHAWTEFAKHGSPGPIGTKNIQWVEAFAANRATPSVEFMQLDPEAYKMVSGFFKRVCDDFWKAKIFA